MRVLHRKPETQRLFVLRKEDWTMLRIFVLLCLYDTLVVSFTPNVTSLGTIHPDVNVQGMITTNETSVIPIDVTAVPSVIDDKPFPYCHCEHEQCEASGINFKVFEVPRQICGPSLWDLTEMNLCPHGWQAAAISTRDQLSELVDCLLCGTSTFFGSSVMKNSVLTAGRVLRTPNDIVNLPPRAALRASGEWEGRPDEERDIDSRIPSMVSSFYDGHPFSQHVTIPNGSYLVFLDGNLKPHCDSRDELSVFRSTDHSGDFEQYSTYHSWTLYSGDSECKDVGDAMNILCQESDNNASALATTTTSASSTPTSSTISSTSTSSTTELTLPTFTTTTPSPIIRTTSSTSTTRTTTTSSSSTSTTTTKNPSPTTTPSRGSTPVVPPQTCCLLNPECQDIPASASASYEPRDTVPCTRSAYNTEDLIPVCPGEEVVIACRPEYNGNITVTCDERTLDLLTSCNTCTLAWIDEIHEMIENGTTSGAEIAREINKEVVNRTLGLNDLAAILEELAALEMLEKTQLDEVPEGEPRVSVAQDYTQETLNIVSSVLSNNQTWDTIGENNSALYGPQFIAIADNSGFMLADAVILDQNGTRENVRQFNINSPEILMIVTVASRLNDSSLSFEFKSPSGRTSVLLTPGFAQDVADDGVKPLKIVALFVSTRAARRPLPGTHNNIPNGSLREVNSEIASVSLQAPGSRTHFKAGRGIDVSYTYTDVEFGPTYRDLHHNPRPDEVPTHVLRSTRCVFWDTPGSQWSTAGCWLTVWQRDAGVCRCDHLTMFAVLTDVHNYVGPDKALDMLGSLVLTLSVLSLLLAMLIFQVSRLKSLRVRITKQLCLSLCVSQLLTGLLLDPDILHLGDKACTGAAAVLHFACLCAVLWMLAEGIHLFHVLHSDADTRSSNTFTVCLFGTYGASATVVTITAAVAVSRGGAVSDAYAGPDTEYCWLNTTDGYIWAFTGPLMVMLVVNFTALTLALHSAASLVINRRRSVPERVRVWIKGSISLSAILGVTWVCGLVYMTSSHVMAYFFTVLAGSQGVFILVFHCFFNATVMTAFLDSLPDKLSFKLSKLVRTTRDSRYAKRSPSVSPDSSIKRRPTLAIGLHMTHETHRPGRKYSENLRYITSTMNYVGKCECAKRTKGTVEQKQEHKVRFSFNQTPSQQQSQSKSTANWNRKRASSEASRGTRTSVLAEECSRRSSSTSDTSVGSYESYNRGLLLLQLQRPSR